MPSSATLLLHTNPLLRFAVLLPLLFMCNSLNGQTLQFSQDQSQQHTQATGSSIQWRACWFELPEEHTVECGDWLTDDKKFRLAFVVLRVTDPAAKPSESPPYVAPLFFLSGGPGNSNFLEPDNVTAWFYWADIAKLGRDIVWVDQRGTGLSQPKFSCDNFANTYRRLLREDLPAEAEYSKSYVAMAQCIEHAKAQGFSLADYSTSISVSDMHQLKTALGYSTAVLMGGSYGTRLGLEWLRLYPNDIEAAILDSVYPQEKGSLLDWLHTTDTSFKNFWAAVNGEHAATDNSVAERAASNQNNTMRNFETDFWQAVRYLTDRPLKVTAKVYSGDWPMTVVVNEHRFINIVFRSLYEIEQHSIILAAIAEVPQGKTNALQQLAEYALNSDLAIEFNPLIFFAVECAETPKVSKQAFELERAKYPQWRAYSAPVWQYDICNLIPPRADIASFKQPFQSDKPILLLSGGLDPVTPARWAFELAERFPNSQHWHRPKLGHGISNSDECVLRSLRYFLDAPMIENPPVCE